MLKTPYTPDTVFQGTDLVLKWEPPPQGLSPVVSRVMQAAQGEKQATVLSGYNAYKPQQWPL